MSITAKIWLIIGIAVSVVGFILLAAAIITRKGEKNDSKSDDEN